ncbi:MAG: DUF222 domain-containing protein [Nigerium sp.]|nr:DUF222 domain-containing protein [Nigerium sp.]
MTVLADHDLGLVPDAALLSTASGALVLAGRMQAFALSLVAEIESRDAAHHELGIGTSGWLAGGLRLTPREANRLIHDANDLTRFTQLREGMLEGSVSASPSQAVTRVLMKLPDDLGFAAEQAAETTMVEYCAEFNSDALKRLSRHLVEVVAPEVADATEAKRLEREARQASQRRHLTFTPDGDGSMLLRGSLPLVAGELLKAQVDALANQTRRAALDAADPLVRPEPVTMGMHRADALVTLIDGAARAQVAPANGGDRPRIMVTIGYDQLLADCTRNGLLPTGTELSAGELRRLACDADVLPVVLGGPSGVLDVGRDHRLVTPAIRAALTARDKGCIFPGCDQPPAACEAHHTIPWQHGGATSLANLVLVCRHHHGVIEPGGRLEYLRWCVRFRDDGVPEVIPPLHVDPKRRPRIHQRFRVPDRAG